MKSKTYKRKLFAFFCIAIIILVATMDIVNYWYTRNIIIEETSNNSSNTILQLKNSNELFVSNIQQFLIALTSDEDIELFEERYNRGLNYEEMSSVYDKLIQILYINPFFTACYVYYPNEEMLIDVNSHYPKYEKLSENVDSEIIYKIYKEAYLKDDSVNLMKIYPIKGNVMQEDCMFVLPIKKVAWKEDVPLLMLKTDSNCFFDNLDALNFVENSEIYIYNNNQGEWIGQKEPFFDLDVLTDTQENVQYVKDEKTGIKYMVNTTYSKEQNWTYYYLFPIKNIQGKLYLTGLMSIIVAVICACVGIFIALLLTNRIYFPLVKISNKFSEEEKDPIEVIRNGVEHLVSENEKLLQEVSETESVLKNIFLKEVIEGEILIYDSIYEELLIHGINVKENMHFQISILSMDSDEMLVKGYNGRQILMYGIYFEEILKKKFSNQVEILLEFIKIDKNTIAVIMGIPVDNVKVESIRSILSDVRDEMELAVNIPVTIGCSEFSDEIENLAELYAHAQEAIKYSFIVGIGKVIEWRKEIFNTPKHKYSYPWNVEKRVISALKQSNENGVREELKKFAECLYAYDIRQSRFAFIQLISDLYKNIDTLSDTMDEKKEIVFKNILEVKTIDNIREKVEKICLDICHIFSQQKKDKVNVVASKAKKYIDESYQNDNLSLVLLAQELDFSVSYVSRVFKSCYGITIKEYITQKRIGKACELLASSEKKLKEIAEMVGYSQQRSFIEIFKKYKDLTPSQYRKNKNKKI